MYNNMYRNRMINNTNRTGFLAPFVLGGITGGLLAPAFYQRPYPYPIYNNYPPYYYQRPYPYY